LFVVTAASFPFALLWMFPLELNDYVQSIVAATLFSSNILFWLESGYFAPEAELKPLLHTWSLAVEEQYYILFPLMLAILWRAPRKWIAMESAFIAIAIVSFASAMIYVETHPDAAFYLLPFRAWELLAGALAAVLLHRKTVPPNTALSALGLVMIGCGLIFASDQLWPSYIALLPVIGTTLIILFASPDRGVGRLLSMPVFVGIGLISYSAYLWHQPILAFMRLRALHEPSTAASIAAVVVTFLLAFLTWRFVERPFRTYRDGNPIVSTKVFTAGAIAAALMLLIPALAIDRTDGLPNRLAPSGILFTEIERNLIGIRADQLPCDTDISFKPVNQEPLPECVFDGSGPGTFFGQRAILIGDSHATIISGALRDELVAEGYQVSVMAFGGCPPFLGHSLPNRDCNLANEAAYNHLKANNYDLVLIASRAQLLIAEDSGYRFSDAAPDLSNSELGLAAFENGLEQLSNLDSKIIYFDPVPEMPLDIGLFARKSAAFEADRGSAAFSIPYVEYVRRAGPLLDVLESMESDQFRRVSVAQQFCKGPGNACTAIEGGVALYADNNHLSTFGVVKLLSQLRKLLAED
jgi:peptidoglycan/LPS O-acetylase OafA/YrhL